MLVKIGEVASINMMGIVSVDMRMHEEVVEKGGLFAKDKVKKTVAVKVTYIDHDGKQATYTLYGFKDSTAAQKVYNEVLGQVKELENVGATQALEEALRNG